MNRDETKKILAAIDSCFPNWHPKDPQFTLDCWWQMLSEYQYRDVSNALQSYISTDTSGFAPSIGQLIDRMNKVRELEDMSEMEAWALVVKACRNGIYGAEREFEKLPIEVQRSVGTPSQIRQWALSETEVFETVIQSNFLRTYRDLCRRKKDFNRLPQRIKDGIPQNGVMKIEHSEN